MQSHAPPSSRVSEGTADRSFFDGWVTQTQRTLGDYVERFSLLHGGCGRCRDPSSDRAQCGALGQLVSVAHGPPGSLSGTQGTERLRAAVPQDGVESRQSGFEQIVA